MRERKNIILLVGKYSFFKTTREMNCGIEIGLISELYFLFQFYFKRHIFSEFAAVNPQTFDEADRFCF